MQFSANKSIFLVTVGLMAAGTLLGVPAAQAATSGVAPLSPTHSTETNHSSSAFSYRLEDQLLAVLRYLPVQFKLASVNTPPATTTTTSTSTTTTSTSTTTTVSPTSTTTTASTTTSGPTTTTTVHAPARSAVSLTTIQKGVFTWRFKSLPAAFRSNWSVGSNNVILQGALMRFQSVNNLPTTGAADPVTWRYLLAATKSHRYDPSPYNFVLVQKGLPQTLKLFTNGQVIFSSLVNTGISVMPTASGTYPVYLRYVSQTMSGTNPNGTHYNDPGIPWVSYFNGGDALHGFIRSSYGWPQSLGCVEMPFAKAAVLWPHTPIGTLVTVQ